MPTLKARLRSAGKAGALRREGFIPAVVYGPEIDSTPLAIDRRDLRALFSQITRSSQIDLAIADDKKGEKIDVFVKRIEYNPVTDEPVHVDFYHPKPGYPLKLHVPVKVTGDALGVKAGGVLNLLFDTVRVRSLPEAIPSLLTLDVSDLGLGDAIRVKDVDFGEATPLLFPEQALVTIMSPRGLEVEEAAELDADIEEGAAGEEAEKAGEEET